MEWQDNGIVLSLKNYGERSGLLEVLTLEHGRHLGIVRDIRSQYRKGSKKRNHCKITFFAFYLTFGELKTTTSFFATVFFPLNNATIAR